MLFFKHENKYVLDSSSILDGRIVQLFGKRFFEGRIIVPQLVHDIVQKASGPDFDKIFSSLANKVPIEYVLDKGNGLIEEVCVLNIASKKKAKVFTASDELCRHAKSYPKVRVIDVRDLYRTLIPIFIPGRMISVRVLKKGLRANEGVGYIEGVKVVVENSVKYVNQVVNARVQTMITSDKGSLVFCSLEEDTSRRITQRRDGSSRGRHR
jgi:uncharacterized protein YacL